MFESGGWVDEQSVVLLDELPAWALLPGDAARHMPPDPDLVRLEDLAAWDVHECDLPAELSAGDPLEQPYEPADSWRERGPEDGPAPWETLSGIQDVAPGPELAMVLDLLDPAAVGDRMLVDTVAAWERLAAWAHLGAALAAGALSRRAPMNPAWSDPVPANRCVAGDELAMRLAWSRPAANRLVRDGRALDNELLLVAEAVRAGTLDIPKLRVLTDRLADRPGELAWAVQEAVLPGAATRTPGQLAADVDRALLAVDPADAADRLTRATAARRVQHPRRLPDGMAGIWAVLPAHDAVRIETTLEATARTARALGDPRTLDQLRADTLVDLATGHALLAGSDDRAGQWQSGPGTDCVASGLDDGVDDDSRANNDHDGAHDTGTAGDDPGSDAGARPRARRAPVVRVPRVRIDVTVALSTLMGLDEQPGELAGFGPISAEQARALAADGIWRRLVTDPLSGAVLDVGRTRYRPPRPLAEHVTARDQVCAGPGCPVPAHRCDLDHTTEYHAVPANGSTAPGTTSADNLGPLSDRCHRLKTDGGFTLRQTAPGVFDWTTPAGLAYRVVPGDHGHVEQLTTTPPRRPTTPNPGYPDEPPF